MINHILLVCSSVFIYELIRAIKFGDLLKNNLKIYKKIFMLYKYKKISDFRKEKLLLNYSKSLLITSVKILIIPISIFVFVMLLNSLSSSFINILISIFGILEQSLIFLIYHFLRKKFHAKL